MSDNALDTFILFVIKQKTDNIIIPILKVIERILANQINKRVKYK